jgi:UDP-glucose 4-epimerase
MKILVTGIAGFLGSHVADRLIQQGHTVSGVDNLVGGYQDNVPREAVFFKMDLLDYDQLENVFNDQEIIIHTACTAYEGLSVFSPAYVSSNTFQITLNALSWAIRSNARKFVFLSSMARYGTQENLPFTEEMTPKPQDPYGISKYAAELAVKNLCETHNLDYTILVPHNIIGPRQKYDDPYRNVASIMINRMLQGKQPIIYGDGEQQRCFSFIDDVVDPLVRSCFDPKASKKVINVGPDEESVTINQLAQILADLLNFKLDPIYFPDRPQEVKIATCSADLARDILGYSTSTDLKTGLSELVDWVKAKGTKPFLYHLPVEIVSEQTPRTWVDEVI